VAPREHLLPIGASHRPRLARSSTVISSEGPIFVESLAYLGASVEPAHDARTFLAYPK
jgi:hypothetical protein